MLLLFWGLSTISLGYRFPSPDSSRKTIVVGYVFATLGGLIGIMKGADMMKKENVEDKFHGKVITAIGIITIIIVMIGAGLLFYFKKCSR